MCSVLDKTNPKRDAYLIQSFAKHKCSGSKASNGHTHTPSQALDTVEADLDAAVSQSQDTTAHYFYDKHRQDEISHALAASKPWLKDPNYFQTAHISSLALVKMTVHARSGGSIEIMGMLTGKIVKNAIVVMDAYPLPVEGTETRVNAQAEGYEFMVQYLDSLKKSGHDENIVGWYHSHPGYGCWLSGIDVATQALNQQFQDPYLAIVVDPERTIANGKVEIGAFRTYTDEYVQSNTMNVSGSTGSFPSGSAVSSSLVQKTDVGGNKRTNNNSIPDEKAQDFGLHSNKYYSLGIEIFRSKMDYLLLQSLWNKFWVKNLIGIEGEENNQDFEESVSHNLTILGALVKAMKSRNKEGVKDRPRRLSSVMERVQVMSSTASCNYTEQAALDSLEPNKYPASISKELSERRSMKQNQQDSDESDYEMKDTDSDVDNREREEKDDDDDNDDNDDDDDENGRQQQKSKPIFMNTVSPTTRYLKNVRRNLTGFTVSSPTQPPLAQMSKLIESNTVLKKEEKADQRTKCSASEASRNLVTLKLQEMLFLGD